MSLSAHTKTNTKVSEHFSIEEIIHSDKAIELGLRNIPDPQAVLVIEKTAQAMERVRAALGNNPIKINSWYRSPKVNTAVGSKSTSQHMKGEAVDFICPAFGSPLDICRKLIQLQDLIRFDQLILEHTWVHISFAITTGQSRCQVLSLLSNHKYAVGLTTKKGVPYV